MALSIKDSRTETAVRKLARIKNINLTDAIREAVEAEIERAENTIPLMQRLEAVGARFIARSTDTGLEADKAFFDAQGGM